MSHEPAVETQTTASTTSSSGGYSADGSNSDQSSHETVPALAIHDVPLSRSRTQRRQYDHDPSHREDDDNESPHHPMHGRRRSHRGGSSVPPSSPETRTGRRHPHAIPDNLLRDTPVADSGRFLDKPITHHDVDWEALLQQQPQPPDGTHSPVLPNHQKTVALAPWNGVRIHHPMDPRIDLSTVALLPCPHVPAPSFWEEPNKRSHAHDTIANHHHHHHHNHNNTVHAPSSHRSTPDPSPTIESYVQLLNAVRPFFQMPGVPLSPTTRTSTLDKHNIDDNVNPTGSPTPPHHPAHSFTQHDSSEGFTSFFTTTHSSTGHSHSNDTNTTASSENNRPRRIAGENASVRNESSSAASLPQLPPGAPLVTDVSSSNPTDSVASTGISNPNTSAGSGSGGNTGSGSNQGSSGSGNEKGSSEEFLAKEDITHSGEATNDGSERSDTNAATKPVPEQTTTPLRAPDPDETVQHDGVHRERKLLDKKRKRIEMRREYEAQQHLESSESSQPSDTDDILCPGTLVALHQVLTFSKTARILVRAIPPFVVEHTNAAYTRLTGIDSHAVVGKPLSSCMEILAWESAKGSQSVREDGQSESSSNESVPSTKLELMVAAGRAHVQVPPSRQPPSKIEMEVLVLSGGLCHFHLAHLTVRPHAMVDRKMAVGHAEQQKHDGAAPSRENSLTGNGASVRGKYSNEPLVLTCRISIAPVVSSPDSVTANEESELSQSKVKRKKYRTEASPNEEVHYRGITTGGSPHSNRKRRQLVTHYIIHLQREDHPCKASSFGSASAGADLLSQPLVSTAPKRDAGSLAQQPEAPVSTTERELVSAIG